MRIAIDSIPDDGFRVDVQRTDRWAADMADAVLEATATELDGHVHLQMRGSSVRARGHLRAVGTRVCERCGEDAPLVLDSEFELSYVPTTDLPDTHAEVRLAPGDLDVGWYENGELDLATVVSEALALQLPARIVCSDTAACDDRASALLSTAGGTPDASGPFAALDKLF